MTVYEMEGFLRGKCLPGDMKVNESNAQYLVRKFSEFESNLSESKREFRAADATIHNLELKLTDMAVQLANAESKCRELAAENGRCKFEISRCHQTVDEMFKHRDKWVDKEWLSAIWSTSKRLMNETPATDAFLAEVRAQGVDMFSEKFGGGTLLSDMVKETAKVFAAQLRKGAAL
ncbi:hypothetical protein NMD10_11150 [Citrobacter portucalensis]|uniref:hypothetical protein n=1 Tax=Citrobacter portucalensis TaxID=1639133 RepID=UPI00351D6770